MRKKHSIKQAAQQMLAVSAIFLLSSTAASAATCATEGHLPGVMADALLGADDSKMAYAWLEKGMELGYGENDKYPPVGTAASGEAYQKAADMFERGYGVVADSKRAEHLHMMGAQFWEATSMYKTAKNYFDSDNTKDGWHWLKRAIACDQAEAVLFGIEQSIREDETEQARLLLQQGIRLNLAAAKHILADQHDKGALGFEKDQHTAFTWYFSAAKDGYAKSMNAVAYYLYKGVVGIPDELAALHWYHQAAKAGDADGMLAYGWLSANRKDGQENIADATYYMEKAVMAGNTDAVAMLKDLN